jgi:Helix-turn-helix domain
MNPRQETPLGPAALARRLRELRERHWPGVRITQGMLAEALGGSTPLVSGWESTTNPSVPPAGRLLAYATIFATPRSMQRGQVRLLPEQELTDDERAARDALHRELLDLRAVAVDRAVPAAAAVRHGTWYFPDVNDVRLVCGKLSGQQHAYVDRLEPNYTELLQFADLDALVELFGHVRMENPSSDVRYRLAEALRPDDLVAHLVLIGGIFLNPASRWIGAKIKLPVRQVKVPELDEGEVFEVDGKRFVPEVSDDEALGLVEDVGLLVRMRNPNNSATTLTICNGVFSRGVLGAVRTLTDAQLRDQNEAYLADRFADASQFGVLMRVPVLRGNVATPDLTKSDIPLYEWTP